jgi:hypothetical protein
MGLPGAAALGRAVASAPREDAGRKNRPGIAGRAVIVSLGIHFHRLEFKPLIARAAPSALAG